MLEGSLRFPFILILSREERGDDIEKDARILSPAAGKGRARRQAMGK
jgi:hypothetical protein